MDEGLQQALVPIGESAYWLFFFIDFLLFGDFGSIMKLSMPTIPPELISVPRGDYIGEPPVSAELAKLMPPCPSSLNLSDCSIAT